MNACAPLQAAVLLSALLVQPALAYEGRLHQELTFLAARYFNACIDQGRLAAEPLTPLQVRYVAKTNRRQAQGNFFGRLFRWDYYDPAEQSSDSFLWLFETRFHRHFNEVTERLERPRSQAAFFSDLGRLVNYVQDVTSPPQTVPVYTGRFWRLSLGDRFNSYPVVAATVRDALDDACDRAREIEGGYAEILKRTAGSTLAAVAAPLDGMPATWRAFWRPDRDPGEFGTYGPAGNNFGRSVSFRCGPREERQRCVLLQDDPLYATFASARHAEAVVATMQVLLLAQQRTPLEGVAPGGH